MIGVVCPETGQAEGLLSPRLNTERINVFLKQFSETIPVEEHAMVVWDGAGFHRSKTLKVPGNITLVSLPADRGTIKDRNGKTLVSIRPSFNLYVTPEDASDLPETLARLGEIIDFDREQVSQKIKESRSFKQVLIKRDIQREAVAIVEENKMRLPGIEIKV